ncbi:MAG: SRPBCC family protein [Patescibacteria group bacterium]
MDPASQDVIQKEIIISAPAERVYSAITDPEKIVAWFPNEVEGSLAVGERPILSFGADGKTQLYIVDARPHEYFAYRWVPGSQHFMGDVLTVPNTLVEFFITEEAEGTKVVLKESGFASLPSPHKEESLKDNNGGWEFMMGRLGKLFAAN